MPELRGLLVDFGGVLTTNVFASFQQFCEAEGLPPDRVKQAFMGDSRELLYELELGRIEEAEFEQSFAVALGLEARQEGLIDRLFGGMHPDDAMLDAVRRAHDAGVKTGMVSNSWGAQRYDMGALGTILDGWVISGEVAVRKPDPKIYTMGAEAVGLEPGECVFVDDLPGNLKPARALGMATVHHKTAEETIPQLEELLGVALQ